MSLPVGTAYQVVGANSGATALTNLTISGTANQVTVGTSGTTITLSLPQSINTTANITLGSITFSPTTSGIVGTTTNNDAAAGKVGEYVSSSVAINAVSLSTATAANVTSISLTAGDWDVRGNIVYSPSGTTSITLMNGGISSTSATLPATNLYVGWAGSATVPPGLLGFEQAQQRFSLSGTTTIYLVTSATFTVSTLTAGGTLTARRVR